MVVNVQDVRYDYSIGEPMTREQMEQQTVQEYAQHNTDNSTSAHPFLFVDKPPNSCSVAAISYLHPNARQRHASGKCQLKVRGVFHDQTKAQAAIAHEVEKKNDENTDIFTVPLYHFFSLPTLEGETNDDKLNDALSVYKDECVDNVKKFHERKQQMLDDVKRQNEIRDKIRKGELDESEASSDAVVKDPVVHDAPVEPDKIMESSDALNDFTYVVCVCVPASIDNCTHVIVKLCAAFKTIDEAKAHGKRLSEDPNYKYYDVHVTTTGEWLQIPPPKDVLPNIEYRDTKLTEALGVYRQGAAKVDEMLKTLKDPEDNFGGSSSDAF